MALPCEKVVEGSIEPDSTTVRLRDESCRDLERGAASGQPGLYRDRHEEEGLG